MRFVTENLDPPTEKYFQQVEKGKGSLRMKCEVFVEGRNRKKGRIKAVA